MEVMERTVHLFRIILQRNQRTSLPTHPLLIIEMQFETLDTFIPHESLQRRSSMRALSPH